CGLPRRWGWQDDGGAYGDGGGEMAAAKAVVVRCDEGDEGGREMKVAVW
ncbi:hypothetical protein Tco_1487839, partial [Tanacetum coccineum]